MQRSGGKNSWVYLGEAKEDKESKMGVGNEAQSEGKQMASGQAHGAVTT